MDTYTMEAPAPPRPHGCRLGAAVLLTLTAACSHGNSQQRHETAAATTPEAPPEDPVAAEEDSPREPALDNAGLDQILRRHFEGVLGGDGQWLLRLAEVPVMIVTDQRANRMRAMALVTEAELEPDRLRTLLEANFDRALDAKYALWEGKLWSVFVHPLSVLGDVELRNAVVQVVNLVKTYGTSYSSTELEFGGQKQGEIQAPAGTTL